MDNIIRNYKELLVNKAGKNHIYFFNYSDQKDEQLSVKGFYAIDEFGVKWMSIDAISSIFKEYFYEQLKSKYFDLNNDYQKLFYCIHFTAGGEEIHEDHKTILSIIDGNIRQGSPRKFLTDSKGEKVNIEAPFNIITNFKFEE